MNKYWVEKPDAELNTDKNILRYWKEAARLQISMPYWSDNNGNQKPGKTVTISLDALRETDGGLELLETIIADIK